MFIAQVIIETQNPKDQGLDFDLIEIDPESIDYETIEMERKYIKNIREKTALLIDLIDKDTLIFYDRPVRNNFEVLGGFKIACQRGAQLRQVKVYNMLFHFKNQKINALNAIAMMYRTKNDEECILLLPDDTEERIRFERKVYLEKASIYTVELGTMDSDVQSELIENLNLLGIQERCAQSLMHEYGHIVN